MSIFTKIINREIPAHIIYEDEHCIAFLDINPVHKGHTLIVPKQEIQRVDDMDEKLRNHCFGIARKLMRHIKSTLKVPFVRMVVEGIEVPHAHIHLIPSWYDDNARTRNHESYETNEAQHYAQRLAITSS
jgi:histidine triad (HIT) family protein